MLLEHVSHDCRGEKRGVMQEYPLWEQKAAQGDYKGAVLAYVIHRRGATFVELQLLLAAYMPVHGKHAIVYAPPETLILWGNVSQAFSALFEALLAEEAIYLVPASVEAYRHGGGILPLPIATRLDKPYTTPHWWPAAIYPMDEVARRHFGKRDVLGRSKKKRSKRE